MRISSLALALLVGASLGMMGCERSEVEPVTEETEPAEGEVVIVETEAPGEPVGAEPESDASASLGLDMPADAPPADGDPEPAVDAQATARPEPLSIGSQAPPLDIEHWIQDGNGKYEPVTEFEEGNVYIVEFWATWCGPCIVSMPHLAELQQEYADQGVRLISVSDEPVETVQEFLDGEVVKAPRAYAEGEERPEQEEPQTYRELTSVYSLTTDPDRSTHAAYMEAANQTGIPTAFIVGKTGEVEWIGHPMTMDEPLQAIVKGDWDRAAYAQEMELKSQIAEAQRMMRQGQMEEGLALVNQLLDKTEDPDLLLNLKVFKLQALIATPDRTEEAATLAADLIDMAAERPPQVMFQLAWIINRATRTTEMPKDLLERTISAAEDVVEDLEPDQRPVMLDTLAHLHEANGNLDAAIAAQQEAVDLSEGRSQERLQQYLDQLKAEKEGGDATPEEAEPADATPEEADPADATPDEADPADATPDEADPADATPEEADPADATPEESANQPDADAPEVVEEVTDSESPEEEAGDGDPAE